MSTAADLEAAYASTRALREESDAAYQLAKALESRGEYGPALNDAKAQHEKLAKAYFAAAAEIRDMEDAFDAALEIEQKAAEKARKAEQVAARARPFIENVRQAGQQVDAAIVNLAEAVADLLKA